MQRGHDAICSSLCLSFSFHRLHSQISSLLQSFEVCLVLCWRRCALCVFPKSAMESSASWTRSVCEESRDNVIDLKTVVLTTTFSDSILNLQLLLLQLTYILTTFTYVPCCLRHSIASAQKPHLCQHFPSIRLCAAAASMGTQTTPYSTSTPLNAIARLRWHRRALHGQLIHHRHQEMIASERTAYHSLVALPQTPFAIAHSRGRYRSTETKSLPHYRSFPQSR